MHAIARLNIASSFPVNETATFAQIATACNIDEQSLRRLLRNAMASFVFREKEPGVVEHTAASRALAQVPFLRNWVDMVSDEMWGSQTRVRRLRNDFFLLSPLTR